MLNSSCLLKHDCIVLIKKTMEGNNIINFTDVSRVLGYSDKHIRPTRKLKNKKDQKAVNELIKFTDNWVKKYTKSK